MKDKFLEGIDIEKIDNDEYRKHPIEFVIKDGVITEVEYMVYKTELIIPEGVIKIADETFDTVETSDLERIVFPSTLVDIGEGNFWDIDYLKEIVINDNFVLDNGCLYTKDYKKLYLCLKDVKKEVFVKEGCEHICSHAFTKCDSVTKIVLPESIKTISNWAFYDCINLKQVVMPKLIDSIGELAFANCFVLEQINLPENLTIIPENIIDNNNIRELRIPDTVTEIKNEGNFTGNPLIKLILSKENKYVENYCIEHGVIYEYDNSNEYTLDEAKELCLAYGKDFLITFEKFYYETDYKEKDTLLLKLQKLFNNVKVAKVKEQGYLFDNQIRKWFLTLEKDIPFDEKDDEMKRYYDNFCSFLLLCRSTQNVIARDDSF